MAGNRGVLTRDHEQPFGGKPWAEIKDWYEDLGWPVLEPLIAIIDSVIACGGERRLGAGTSMHDLRVTRLVDGRPASGVDVMRVSTTSSGIPPKVEVTITHTSVSGQTDTITRPARDAVPLFWRFTTQKWDIEPWR